MQSTFSFIGTVIKVVDGDTLRILLDLRVPIRRKDVDLGFSILIKNKRLVYSLDGRLLGLNCAEHGTPGGDAATAFVKSLLPAGASVRVTTTKNSTDKYGGRYDATVILSDGTNLNDLLIRLGWAAPWNGLGSKPIPAYPPVPQNGPHP